MNLQNLPRSISDPTRFDYAFPIKDYFGPNKARNHDTLVFTDYSAQEARLAGVLAGDEQMINAFLDPSRDVHTETASLVFKVPVEEVTKDLRTRAKAVTFGLMYGEDPNSFAGKNNMPIEESEQLFEDYYAGKPKIKELIDIAQSSATRDGYIDVPGSGFRRNLEDVWSADFKTKNGALRQALNTMVQGGSAYLTQKALITINQYFRAYDIDAYIMVTVHDSIVCSTKRELVPTVATIMQVAMENVEVDYLNIEHNGNPIRFPMVADVGVGVTYNKEFEYDKEDFLSFASSDGFSQYYTALKELKDRLEADLISEEDYEAQSQAIKDKKQEYQEIK